MKYRVYKLKKGKAKQWKDWCDFLMEHKEEALATVREEGGTCEGCVQVSEYVVFYGDTTRSADMTKEINIKHRQNVQECLEPYDCDTLYEFRE